jgi:hypothetical protein
MQFTKGETRNPQKIAHASKVVNLFTRALVPPFIGRQREFLHSENTLLSKNIHSVNMYKNVFYIP